jgi:hypothetical protein
MQYSVRVETALLLQIMATRPAVQTNGPIETMLEHEIRMRAYALYEQREKCDGHAVDDWLKAEAEVLTRCGLYRTGGRI